MTNMRHDAFVLDRLKTPIGEALMVVDGRGRLRAFDWHDHEERMLKLMKRCNGPSSTLSHGGAPTALRSRVDDYFQGDLERLDGIECETGGTPFQQNVWTALRTIPVGTTVSYGQLAVQIGSPKAVRAVGLANGANPVGLIIPCHRVIGSNGSLTGYGGGMDRKRWLLIHERAPFRA
jgi:methylated-DNA-[protein]-cysteine S-methyltransferase